MNNLTHARRVITTSAAALIALFVLAIGSTNANAQCCDYVVTVNKGVSCPITVNYAIYDNSGLIPNGTTYPANGFDFINYVPCPNRLQAVEIQTLGGVPVLIPASGDRLLVHLSNDCCVFVTINQIWPPAPCWHVLIEPAVCP